MAVSEFALFLSESVFLSLFDSFVTLFLMCNIPGGRCDLIWNLSNSRPVAVACEYGNELSGSIKCGEFLD